MARLMRHQDLAKAYSHDAKWLDMMSYSRKAAGVFKLGLERLESGKTYDVGGKRVQADGQGRASVDVKIDGRTPVMVSPL